MFARSGGPGRPDGSWWLGERSGWGRLRKERNHELSLGAVPESRVLIRGMSGGGVERA